MGKLFVEGKTPYVDFFDHKGPILIFIEALALAPFVEERVGIFFLQIINFTLIQLLIFLIARNFLSVINSISVVLLSLYMLSLSMDGGNLTEEYSLPFNLLTLLITVKYYLSDKREITLFSAGIIGICIACLFWMRINNMGVICACALYLFIFTLSRKDWRNLQKLLLGSLIGFLIITLPLLFYFLYKDAFNEMIYATFTFNFKYLKYKGVAWALYSPFMYLLNFWTAYIILFLGTLIYCYKNRKWSLILLSSFLLFFGLISTRFGLYVHHYAILNIPLLVLGLSLIMYSYRTFLTKRSAGIATLIISCLLLVGNTALKYDTSRSRKDFDDTAFINESDEVMKQIPYNQRDSLYVYNVHPRFYLYADIGPYYKYFVLQEWHGVHDPQIYDQIKDEMASRPPLWIVMESGYTAEDNYMPKNEYFFKMLEDDYTLYYENDGFDLYKRK